MADIQRHWAGRATGRLHPYLADDALVPVPLLPLDANVLIEDQARQVLFRPLPEGLLLFKGHLFRQGVFCAAGAERQGR